ncbi:MAG: ABC transporter ATP-binding protein [Nitriliruptoraceae bacterium]
MTSVRTDDDAAIVVRGLSKRYGPTLAVDQLDLAVGYGETFALLGPNGAGKTTTVECCEGYRVPDQGVVRVLGLNPRADAAKLRPRVGLMLQENGVYPLARPLEVLRLFATFYRDPLDPSELIERVGLSDSIKTRFRDLSGGQKQRLSLALALIGRPDVVFLDEPTAGLDPGARRLTWTHIGELKRAGVTVVLTTHLLDEAEALADRVAIIDRGRLLALGTPDELTHGDRESVEFSARPGLEVGQLSAAIGHPVVELRPGRYEIAAANDPQLIARLAGWLETHEVVLGELQAGKQSLEEVFLRLTGVAADAIIDEVERHLVREASEDLPHDRASERSRATDTREAP